MVISRMSVSMVPRFGAGVIGQLLAASIWRQDESYFDVYIIVVHHNSPSSAVVPPPFLRHSHSVTAFLFPCPFPASHGPLSSTFLNRSPSFFYLSSTVDAFLARFCRIYPFINFLLIRKVSSFVDTMIYINHSLFLFHLALF